jgi:acyl homoserine lactone synthase
MQIDCLADVSLSDTQRTELAAYRYAVFVGHLGWELPCPEGYDQDQFDIADAVHLAARNDAGRIVGYARLLPTTGSYLLAELFPELLGQQPAPQHAEVWELSRYAARDTEGPSDAAAELLIGKQVLAQAVRTAALHGAQRLVFCTTVAIERLAKRWGVDIHRVAAPQRLNGQLLVAAVIECNAHTLGALDAALDARPAARASIELGALQLALPGC